jgi:hypothetical protein
MFASGEKIRINTERERERKFSWFKKEKKQSPPALPGFFEHLL